MQTCWPNNPSGLTVQEVPPQGIPLGMVALTINHHHVCPQGAETAIDARGTKGLCCLSSHHLPWTKGWRVTGAHYQQLPGHPGLIDQMDPSIPNKGDDTERMELT